MAHESKHQESEKISDHQRDCLSRRTSHETSRLEKVPSVPYPELPSVLGKLVAGVETELADNLVGVYLVGSLATGDFDLDSDVDFLVVTEEELLDKTVRSLQVLHTYIHSIDCYPARHLEGSYISLGQLNQSEAVGVHPLWYLDNGSTTFEYSVHDNQWHVRWILRERGITLVGPEPATLLDPVPVNALRAEVVATMHLIADHFVEEMNGPLTFRNSRFGQSFTVLTYCRMLHTLQTGKVQSKFIDMQWAVKFLDPAWTGLIQRAWEERKGVRHGIKIGQRANSQALKETLEFIRYTVREGKRRYSANLS